MRVEHSPYSLLLILLYLAVVTALGIVSSRKGRERSASEYFVGSRRLGAMGLGLSLFLTTAAGMWLLGSVNSAPRISSLGFWYGIFAVVFALVLGYRFAPIYLKSQVFTVPQFLSLRFNTTTSLYLSGFSILFYVGVKVPLVLTIASWVIDRVLGWNVMTSSGLMVVVVLIGLYTLAGGFPSVIATQMVQAVIVLAGSTAMAIWFLFTPAVSSQIAAVSLLGDMEQSWIVWLPGLAIVLAWHWCVDQYIVQRVLATRNVQQVRRGTMFAALFIALEIVLIVVISASFTQVSSGAVDAVAPWVKDVGGVAFLALLMGTLAGDFHTAATLFTMDFYRSAYPDASDTSLVLIGRLSTTMVVILAIIAVSTISLVDARLIAMLLQVQIHFAPPVVAVFLFGMYWQRTNSKGALWGLVCGELVGATDLAIRFFRSASGVDSRMFDGPASLNLFGFGIISLVVSSAILVAVSLVTEAPSRETTTYMSLLRRKES